MVAPENNDNPRNFQHFQPLSKIRLSQKSLTSNTSKNFLLSHHKIVKNKKILENKLPKKNNFSAFLLPYLENENKPENEKLIEGYMSRIKIEELISVLFIIISIFSGIGYYEAKNCQSEKCLEENFNLKNDISDISLILCSIGSICFIILLFPKYYHYYMYYKEAKYIHFYENFFNSELLLYFIIEFIFAFIHPNYFLKDKNFTTNYKWNFIKINYEVNDILLAIHLFKFIYIIRIIAIISDFYTARADRICKMFGKEINIFFSFKAFLITYRNFTLISITIVFCLFFGYILKIIESPINDNNGFQSLMDSLWFIFCTITSVGYGDIFPKSLIGRIIGCLVAFFGTIFLALILAVFQGQTALDEKELNTYQFILRLKDKDELKKASVNFISTRYLFLTLKKKFEYGEINNNVITRKYLIFLAKQLNDNRINFLILLHKFQLKYKVDYDADKVKQLIENISVIYIDNAKAITKLQKKLKNLFVNISDRLNKELSKDMSCNDRNKYKKKITGKFFKKEVKFKE